MSKTSQSKKPSYSLMRTIRLSCAIAIPVILLNLFLGVFTLVNIRQQNLDSISSSVALYQEETALKLDSIEHFVQWSAVNEPLFTQMEEADNLDTLKTLLAIFRSRVSDSQLVTGTEYQYFLYFEPSNTFYNASELHYNYQEYLSIKAFILDLVKTGASLKTNSTWQCTTIGETTYLYYLITYRGRTFATFVDVRDLIKPLIDINLGRNGALVVTDLQGSTLYATNSVKRPQKYRSDALFFNLLSFTYEKEALPIQLKLYIDNFNNYGRLVLFQYVLIFAALIVCIVLSVYLFTMYRKVIKPINDFSTSLANINEQGELLDLQSSNIQELEQTNEQFRNLMREIAKLKITLFENELNEKRFQITFLQNQIRPHFYLNCLTTISSMAQLGKTKDIEKMVLFTSRYLRYLFQTDKEAVCIKYELMHIQSYLDIQALRYGPVFQYSCSIEKEDEDATLPPLLLITFIENTIKHSIAPNGQLQIKLSVASEYRDDAKLLCIDIVDNGQGFPEEVLQKLSRGESLNTAETSHVGITNSIQRLSLLYGTDYQIAFSNEPEGGAHIKLSIPYHISEGQA